MSEEVQEIKATDYEREVLQSDVPVVLDFFSQECPPCEALAPKYEAVASRFAGRVRFLKIFRQENRELAQKLGVTGSPTLLFFRGGQEQGDRLTGEIPRSALTRAVETILQG